MCYTVKVDTMTAAALCAVGAEKVVSNELRKLGFSIEDAQFGKVRFLSDTAGLYRALMGLRAADRVLLEAGSFPADNFDDLYKGANAVPWENYIPRGMGFKVDKVRTKRSQLEAVTSIQGVVHKAAAERLCRIYGLKRLPETSNPAELRVHIDKNNVSLLLDLAGEPLFKRGYRIDGGIAPLRETTAAALLLLAGWRRKFTLYDPFCGSGTIAIEAAMYAWDMAPGINRRFMLQDLAIADKETEKRERKSFLDRIDFSRPIRIHGSDADSHAVMGARTNAEQAYNLVVSGRQKFEEEESPEFRYPRGRRSITRDDDRPVPRLPGLPQFRALSLQDSRPPETEDDGAPGCIITNPPYGKRLGERSDSEAGYAEMAVLARHFTGWKLGVVCDHPGFESFFGKKADSCKEITNGAFPVYFFLYERL